MLRLVWLLAVVLFDGRVLAQATADEALQQQRVITTQGRDLEQGVADTDAVRVEGRLRPCPVPSGAHLVSPFRLGVAAPPPDR